MGQAAAVAIPHHVARVAAETLSNRDNTMVTRVNDLAGTQSFATQVSIYDQANRLALQDTFNDDGTAVQTGFDPGNQNPNFDHYVETFNSFLQRTGETDTYDDHGHADFVFDVRSLPNPHWETALRKLNGRDAAVIEYLSGFASVRSMIADLTAFLEKRLSEFSQVNRSYLTIAIGCTGGQHRSVYIAEQLAAHFRNSHPQVLTRHDSLHKA